MPSISFHLKYLQMHCKTPAKHVLSRTTRVYASKLLGQSPTLQFTHLTVLPCRPAPIDINDGLISASQALHICCNLRCGDLGVEQLDQPLLPVGHRLLYIIRTNQLLVHQACQPGNAVLHHLVHVWRAWGEGGPVVSCEDAPILQLGQRRLVHAVIVEAVDWLLLLIT